MVGTETSTLNEIDNSYGVLNRKRQYDRAYRLRCKEKKEKNEQDMAVLTAENDKLKRENEQFKSEGVKQSEMVRTQNEQIGVVNSELRRLKPQLQTQNAVVDALSSRVASRKDSMDLQCENRQLRLVRSLLIKKINGDDHSNLIQLQEKSTKLEQEKNALQVIIDALCAKR
ncbi:hypothetical protein OIU85_029303 [Salix viminalis]|uniref:Uncharacterized protein n=1 Tax=Salix viminalis TaxID=40686 RepID=A0A9Q0QB03_SALVM|nr:hypothetical protein OIU85_029303 [Salix viminalis]